MAKPNTRQTLIDYSLRRLGHPVIEINVDEDQLDDRVDDALQFFSEYHFDGVEKVFLKYIVTQADINNGYISLTSDVSSPTKFIEGAGLSGPSSDFMTVTETGISQSSVTIDDLITSVIGVWHFSQSTVNMFDVRYQYALNDLYSFGSIDLIQYTVTQSYLSLLQQILSPEHAVRFSRKTKKLYIDMKWSTDVKVGSMIVIEAYRVIDPKVYTAVYNDMLLKQYVTALIKRQWGANLSKFQGIELPGGIKFNGAEIFQQAQEEIKEIEDTVQSKWETPPMFSTG